jgi:hypothetical protein
MVIEMIDPTFELLWKQIAEAYQQVANNATRNINFEHDKYSVMIVRTPIKDGDAIMITITDDREPDPPTLIAP